MPTETTIARQISEWLRRQRNCFYFRAVAGRGQMTGLPDIVLCWGGVFIGLEVKQPGRKATKIQAAIGEQIKRGGGYWHVVYSLQDVQDILATIERIR